MVASVFEPESDAPAEPPVDYRRLARRVRCRLGNDPTGKQRALAALAKQCDRTRRATEPAPAPVPATAAVVDNGVRAFAQAVSTSFDGPILRFSRRQELIRQAEALGIRRFDANLLIAAVQHRLGSEKAERAALPASGKSKWRMALPIAVVIGLQAAISAGVWVLLHP